MIRSTSCTRRHCRFERTDARVWRTTDCVGSALARGAAELEREASNDSRQVLESIVAVLNSKVDLDERGEQILAGAVTLLGTCRKDELRGLTPTWGVSRRNNGKERASAELQEELQQKVVDAWELW